MHAKLYLRSIFIFVLNCISMKKFFLSSPSLFLWVIAFCGVVFLFHSCTPQSQLIYFQPKQNTEDPYTPVSLTYAEGTNNNPPEYTLREKDLLYVQVNSATDREINELFSSKVGGNYATQNELGVYLNSYSIDSVGDITIPVIGKVRVVGLTVSGARDAIADKAKDFTRDTPVVICKMTNYKITILGDVARPGTYTFYQDNVNIFQAISQAGDLTKYGNRARVRVVRKGAKEDLMYYVNLKEADIVQHPHYYLLPGDIVFVEPNKVAKSFQMAEFPWSILFSTVSTISTIVTLLVAVQKK